MVHHTLRKWVMAPMSRPRAASVKMRARLPSGARLRIMPGMTERAILVAYATNAGSTAAAEIAESEAKLDAVRTAICTA